MGYEESLKQFLDLTRQELQVLCKKHNLPANKSHSLLAKSLALLIEKENSSSAPERERPFVSNSTQAHIGTSSDRIANTKETSIGVSDKTHFTVGSKDDRKRGSYNDRDDDRQHLRMEHQIGPSGKPMPETSKKAFDTSISFVSPILVNNGKAEHCGCSSSRPGIGDPMRSQSAANIEKNSLAPQLGFKCHVSTANKEDQISLEPNSIAPEFRKHSVSDSGMVSTLCRHAKAGECFIERGCTSSDKISANATPSLQFFVMSEEGINLFVDLNSTPSKWIHSFKEEVCIHPNTHHCEPGNFSNFISSLVSKDDHSRISPSGNIIVDIQSKGAESITPCTNSSLSSTFGENSHLEACPLDATAVTSRSSASMLLGTLVETSGSQEGVPVVSSSCLTSDVQNSMAPDVMPCALDDKGLPQNSVDVSLRTERTSPLIPDASQQPTGNIDTVSPGNAVRSDEGNSCPTSTGKQENLDASNAVQLHNNSDVHEVLMESEPVETAATEEDAEYGDRLSVSCQLAGQMLPNFSVNDDQSDASSADHHPVAGSSNLRNPMSSAALDNTTSLKPKRSTELAHCRDSADKKRLHDTEDPEEFQSKRKLACDENTRNILMSLRSAKAYAKEAQRNPTVLPRRSMRLVSK